LKEEEIKRVGDDIQWKVRVIAIFFELKPALLERFTSEMKLRPVNVLPLKWSCLERFASKRKFFLE